MDRSAPCRCPSACRPARAGRAESEARTWAPPHAMAVSPPPAPPAAHRTPISTECSTTSHSPAADSGSSSVEGGLADQLQRCLLVHLMLP
eukprot:363393-Chlamydomonas_euryale.AAC.3